MYISYVAQPIQSVDGKVIVETKTRPVFIERHSDVDHTVTVTYVPTGDSLTLYESSGELYQDPPHLKPSNKNWDVHVDRTVPVISQKWDVGTYVGLVMGPSVGSTGPHVDTGVRLSPCRLFDLLAPDLLIGREAAGVGISAYPPPEVFGHVFQHLGIGCGWVWSYDRGNGALMPYASLSIVF